MIYLPEVRIREKSILFVNTFYIFAKSFKNTKCAFAILCGYLNCSKLDDGIS